MKLAIVLLIFICLIAADKILTMWSLHELSKNNPNYIQAEKNIAARWFFEKTGLLWGTILFGILTICTLTLAYWFLSKLMGGELTFWLIVALYGYVIINNIIYLLKFKGVIPYG